MHEGNLGRLTGVMAAAVLMLGALSASAQVLLLDPLTQPKFVNPLPIPSAIDARMGGSYEIPVTEFEQSLGLVDPVTGLPLLTTVWGYGGTYPGPTFVVQQGAPIDVLWENELVDEEGDPLPHRLPIDTSVHWAEPEGYPASGVPIVTHIHGGRTESASDGLPEAWFTPDFALTGPDFVKQTYHYENDQEAGTVWYHDHALGITRLNVYMGMAGFYIIRDDNEDYLTENDMLPTGPYELGLAIQDRMFTAAGQLHYPATPPTPTAPDPSVLPEFFGDHILVNGAAWPVLDVEPRQYRFRFLNGSDSRFYDLSLVDRTLGMTPVTAPPFHQIGTDLSLLDAPVTLRRLVMGTGERLDVVVDFSDPALAGHTFILRNQGRSPFPNGAPVDPRTTGQIMAFRVSLPLNPSYPLTPLPANLRPLHGPHTPLVQDAATRNLLLFEGMDPFGRMFPSLGTVADGMMMWHDPITENPMLNDVEVWEVYNSTPDAHPIHLHLVAFQVVSRQKFKATQDPMTGALTNIKLVGQPKPPAPQEKGWKDTAIMYPGEVTRIIAKFDLEGLYVWHCHILSHEDHEMMRPYRVGPPEESAPMVMTPGGSSPAAEGLAGATLLAAEPNPFNPSTKIAFQLPSASLVGLQIFDVRGRLVRTLADGALPAGHHAFEWNGRSDSGLQSPSGVYVYRLRTGEVVQSRKMMLVE